MTRQPLDVLVLAVIVALCIVGAVLLTALGTDVPAFVEYVGAATAGGLAGVAIPSRKP